MMMLPQFHRDDKVWYHQTSVVILRVGGHRIEVGFADGRSSWVYPEDLSFNLPEVLPEVIRMPPAPEPEPETTDEEIIEVEWEWCEKDQRIHGVGSNDLGHKNNCDAPHYPLRYSKPVCHHLWIDIPACGHCGALKTQYT